MLNDIIFMISNNPLEFNHFSKILKINRDNTFAKSTKIQITSNNIANGLLDNNEYLFK